MYNSIDIMMSKTKNRNHKLSNNNLNKSGFTCQFSPNMSQTFDKFNDLQQYFKSPRIAN